MGFKNYSLKYLQSGPIAMICKKMDFTIVFGHACANISPITRSNEEIESVENGNEIAIVAIMEELYQNFSNN